MPSLRPHGFTLLFVCINACALDAPEATVVAQPIAGGTRLLRAAIVGLITPSDDPNTLHGCTGVMINEYTIVTAAHCVSVPAGTAEWVALSAVYQRPSDAQVVCLTGGDVYFENDRTPQCSTSPYYGVFVHADYREEWVPGDIAVLISQTAFEGVGTDDYAYLDIDSPAELSSLGVYGYGPDGTRGAGVLRGGVGEVWDFNTVQLDLQATDARVCHGDSGGPAALFYDEHEPRLQVLGLLSTGENKGVLSCTVEGGGEHFVRPSAYASFIEAAMGMRCRRVSAHGRQVLDCTLS